MEPSLQLSLAVEPPPALRRGLGGAQEAIAVRLSANIDTFSGEEDAVVISLPWISIFLAARMTLFFFFCFARNVQPDMRGYAGDLHTSAGC